MSHATPALLCAHVMRARTVRGLWLALLVSLATCGAEAGATDPLPSWNDGAAKSAMVKLVSGARVSPRPAERVAEHWTVVGVKQDRKRVCAFDAR